VRTFPDGMAVAGCDQLNDPMISSCVATALLPGAAYQFTVSAECLAPAMSSPLSAPSAPVSTAGGRPADAPLYAAAHDPTATSLELTWLAGPLNDCVFAYWEVLTFPDGFPVMGCDHSGYSTTTCTVAGLAPATAYQFEVKAVCLDPALNSPPVVSAPVTTGNF
jgi:hypothetical protein